MPAQGSNHDGPLSIKGGGLKLFDVNRATVKFSEERCARLVLTSAQLLAGVAGTTIYNLVPAPGAGKFIEFLGALLIMKHGGTAYVCTGNLAFVLGTNVYYPGLNVPLAANFNSAAADVMVTVPVNTTVTAVPATVFNAPMGLAWNTGAPGASLTTGNGQLIVQVSYRIQDVNL